MSYTVTIYKGDDQERLGELRRAVAVAERYAKAQAAEPRRFGDALPGDEDVKAAQAACDAFIDEAAERAEAWVLDHIGHSAFRSLLREHPPREVTSTAEDGTTKVETHSDDEAWGVNTETFPEALLLYFDPDDPDIRTVATLKVGNRNIAKDVAAMRKRVKRLSEGQLTDLWTSAFLLNKAGVSDPKLDRFSPATPRSNAT